MYAHAQMHFAGVLQLELTLRQMALLTLSNEEGGVRLTRNLTLGCELSCTTVHGKTFRGNLVAQDEEAMLVVMSILSSCVLCVVVETLHGMPALFKHVKSSILTHNPRRGPLCHITCW